MAKASCSNARQKARRNSCIKRRITGPRVLRRGIACNWEVRSRSTIVQLLWIGGHGYGQRDRKGKGGFVRRPFRWLLLLCCQFLGLAFVPHQLKRALGFFVCLRNFFLHLGGRFFHFWREADVAVVLHAGAGRDEASHDDVLFQAAQVIDRCLEWKLR